MDELSLVMTLLTTIVFSLAVIASKSQIRHNLKWYYVLVLFFESAILGIFNAADIFSFFLFWELELIPAYFLIAHWGEGNSAKLMKDIMGTVTQVTDGLKESTGVDLSAVLSGFLGGKVAAESSDDSNNK